MKNQLLMALLFWSLSPAYSQSGSNEQLKAQFGISSNLNETQIKGYLFDDAFTGDRTRHSFGVNVMSYWELKKNWYLGFGANFSAMSFLNRTSFEKKQEVADPINTHEQSIQNIVGNSTVNFGISIDQSPCMNSVYTDDFEFTTRFNSLNKIHSLGIPILLGKTVGKKLKKGYAEIALIPRLIIKKETIYTDLRGLGLGRPYFRSCQKQEYPGGSHRVGELVDTQIEFVDYNLKDSGLDATIEIGMMERLEKVYYKIGVFYGESLTPFTQIEGKNYFGQMLGCKLEIGFLAFKK